MNTCAAYRRLGKAWAFTLLYAVLLPAPTCRGEEPPPAEGPPVILQPTDAPLLTRGQRTLRTPGESVRWSVVSGYGTLAPERGPTTRVTAGGLWGPLVIRAQREGPEEAPSTEVTLEVALPPTEVQASEVALLPTVKRLQEDVLDLGAATLAFAGAPDDVTALEPGDIFVVPGSGNGAAEEVRQVAEVAVLEGPACPPSLLPLLEAKAFVHHQGFRHRATVLGTVAAAPKKVFKSIHHRSTLRLDLESLTSAPGWDKVRRWLPEQLSISSPLAKGRPGGVTFAFDGVRIFEWQGRTLTFSGAITLTGAIEHGTEVDMENAQGYSEQKIAVRMAYQGAIVASLTEFSWPEAGDYQRLLPIPFPILIPMGAATLRVNLFPFYLKAKGWVDGELDVDGEVALDKVIRKNLATGELSLSGPGFSWPAKAEVSLALEGRLKMFIGFFPVEVSMGFAGVEFAGFACPTGVRGTLAGHLVGPLGNPPEADACASLNWDTELLLFLRFPAGFWSWFNPADWGFHKLTLLFHTCQLHTWNKNCLEDWDHDPHHTHPAQPRTLAPPPGLLGGAWLEGTVGVPVVLVAPGGAEGAWSQVDGPCPVPMGACAGPEFLFTPLLPGRYAFQVQDRAGGADGLCRTFDVRVTR
jgi:hypothetical protein